MLSESLYNIGKKYNNIIKYNIDYDKLALLDYVCAVHLQWLLLLEYQLTDEQRDTLSTMLNNLKIS